MQSCTARASSAVMGVLTEHVASRAGRMAELENAAWKDDRRFRIMSVDQGVFSFLDLFMHTPSKPRSSAGAPSKFLHEDEGKNISITGGPLSLPHLPTTPALCYPALPQVRQDSWLK